jgi:hypothetical protein
MLQRVVGHINVTGRFTKKAPEGAACGFLKKEECLTGCWIVKQYSYSYLLDASFVCCVAKLRRILPIIVP